MKFVDEAYSEIARAMVVMVQPRSDTKNTRSSADLMAGMVAVVAMSTLWPTPT